MKILEDFVRGFKQEMKVSEVQPRERPRRGWTVFIVLTFLALGALALYDLTR